MFAPLVESRAQVCDGVVEHGREEVLQLEVDGVIAKRVGHGNRQVLHA